MDRENRARNWASLLIKIRMIGIIPTEKSKNANLVQGYSIVFHSQDLHWNYFHKFVQNLKHHFDHQLIFTTLFLPAFSPYCSAIFSTFATAIMAAIPEQGKTLDFLSKQHYFQLLERRLKSAS